MKSSKFLLLAALVVFALALQGCAENSPEMELVAGEIFRDEFDSETLAEHWTVGPNPEHRRDDKWSLTSYPGYLTITTQDSDIHETSNRPINFFMYKVPYKHFEAVTRIIFQPEQDFEQAGLFIYKDMDNYARLARVHAFGNQSVEPALETDGSYREWIQTIGNTAEIYLKMSMIRGQLGYHYSFDGVEWVEIDSRPYVRWDDVYLVLYAISPISARQIDALFDYVEVTELKFEPVQQ